MKTSQEIQANAIDATNAAELADACAIAKDQDWNAESTTWTFDDNSTLTISGSDVTAKDGDE